MPELEQLGKLLLVGGIILVGIGGFFILAGRVSWFGQLPGDIYIEGDNYTVYFPLTTCVLLSIILSFLMYLLNF